MKEICKFLVENWRIILEVIVLLSSVVIFIIKKRPVKVVDSVKTLITEALPSFINDAERFRTVLFGQEFVPNGDDKLKIVRRKVFSLLEDCGVDPKDFDIYWNAVYPLVEEILSTPTKKGGLGREQEKNNAQEER